MRWEYAKQLPDIDSFVFSGADDIFLCFEALSKNWESATSPDSAFLPFHPQPPSTEQAFLSVKKKIIKRGEREIREIILLALCFPGYVI